MATFCCVAQKAASVAQAIFCHHRYFVNVDISSSAILCQQRYFCHRRYFVIADIFASPIFCGYLCRGSCFLSYTAENSHHLTAKIISKEALF
jgi:hypothetical protein